MSTPEPDSSSVPILPSVEGGWELQALARTDAPDDPGEPALSAIELWAPSRPDQLYDLDATPDAAEYHDSMPYWAWLWDAAPTMVRALERRAIRGRVLEVGAGLGAVGVALAARSKGHVQVTLTDHDPLSIAALQANAARYPEALLSVRALDWRSPSDAPGAPFSTIIGCEVIYDPKSHAALLDVFQRYLKRDGHVYLVDPGRPQLPQFLRRARARGFLATTETVDGERAEPERGELRVVELFIDVRRNGA